MKRIICYFLTMLCITAFSLSSCKGKEETENNVLVGTEWNNNTGLLALHFKSNSKVDLKYTIAGVHTFSFEKGYTLEGNNLKIEDCKETYGNKEYYLVKNFKADLKDDEMTASFLTMKGKPKPEDDPEDNLETKNIRLKKR